MNAKDELIEVIGIRNMTACAIKHSDKLYVWDEGDLVSKEKLMKALDFENEHGLQDFLGVVWLDDGTWLDIGDWWKHIERPSLDGVVIDLMKVGAYDGNGARIVRLGAL